MYQRVMSIAAVLTIAGLLILSPQFFASVAARSNQIRLIVHEPRLHFQSADCLDQHINEHIYARLVDKELMDRGYTAFSVDAVATIDKIIISVEHWGEPEESAGIAQSAADGIRKPPPAHLVEQERVLIPYEDRLMAEAPQLGASVTAALLATAAPSYFSCPPKKIRVEARKLSDWVPGDIEVYERQGIGQFTRLFSSQKGNSTFPNAWGDLPVSPTERHSNLAVSNPNILFIGYKGRADPRSTTKLLAIIYESIAGTGILARDVRPFGKAGFVMQGEGSVLAGIQHNIRAAFKPSLAPQMRPGTLQQAWASVCRFHDKKHEGNIQLWDEKIAHVYFEYKTHNTYCEKAPNLARSTLAPDLISYLIYIPEAASEPPSYERNMSFELCTLEEKFTRKGLSVAAYALRKHLRFDAGLALNVQFSKIEGSCVRGAVFAPKANIEALAELLIDFDFANDAYAKRYSAAAIIYHCTKGDPTLCPKKGAHRPVTKPPRLKIYLKWNGF